MSLDQTRSSQFAFVALHYAPLSSMILFIGTGTHVVPRPWAQNSCSSSTSGVRKELMLRLADHFNQPTTPTNITISKIYCTQHSNRFHNYVAIIRKSSGMTLARLLAWEVTYINCFKRLYFQFFSWFCVILIARYHRVDLWGWLGNSTWQHRFDSKMQLHSVNDCLLSPAACWVLLVFPQLTLKSHSEWSTVPCKFNVNLM